MRTPTYYRIRWAVRVIVWTALAMAALTAAQAIIWLAWVGAGA